MTDIAKLVARHQEIKAHLDAEEAKFSAYKKPYQDEQTDIQGQIHTMMLEQGVKSFKTDTGTAILSTVVTPKVTDKEKFLDFVLDNWDKYGAMLQIGAPQKDALQEYMDANENKLPPFVDVSTFVRFSIRKA